MDQETTREPVGEPMRSSLPPPIPVVPVEAPRVPVARPKAITSLARWLLIVAAVNLVIMLMAVPRFWGRGTMVTTLFGLLMTADVLLTVGGFLVFGIALLRMAWWARKGTIAFLLAYFFLRLAVSLVPAILRSIGTPGALGRELADLGGGLLIRILFIGSCIYTLTRPEIVEAFAHKHRDQPWGGIV